MRASFPRSDLPADRFGEDLGPWSGPDFAIAVLRDGVARRTRKPGRSEVDQPGADCKGRSGRFTATVVLDIDSTEIPVYGNQEQSAYNDISSPPAITRCCCSIVKRLLGGETPARQRVQRRRLGRAIVARDRAAAEERKEVVVRADAAFAKPEIYEALEQWGVNYAVRIPASENLERDIAEFLPRPVGRPSIRPCRVQELSLPGSELEKGHRWWPRWSITRASCSREWLHRHEPEPASGQWCASTTSVDGGAMDQRSKQALR